MSNETEAASGEEKPETTRDKLLDFILRLTEAGAAGASFWTSGVFYKQRDLERDQIREELNIAESDSAYYATGTVAETQQVIKTPGQIKNIRTVTHYPDRTTDLRAKLALREGISGPELLFGLTGAAIVLRRAAASSFGRKPAGSKTSGPKIVP